MSRIWLRKPAARDVAVIPVAGDPAPVSTLLDLSGQQALIGFMRHDGCPFSEHMVKQLRQWQVAHPDVSVFVVSHGEAAMTQRWLDEIGGLGDIRLIQDSERALYAAWGLGYVPFWHFGGPASLLGVVRLWFKGIHNRTASGTRYQRSGLFLIADGTVVWQHVPESAQAFRLPPESVSRV